MALTSKKALLETFTSLIQIKRFRGKINLRKPRAPHFQKALYLELTKPYFPKKEQKPLVDLCTKGVKFWKKTDEENHFQRFIANDLKNLFETSRLIAFYHLNPMIYDREFKAFASFKKQNMTYKKYGKKTLEMAVTGTPYEAVLDFYVSQNAMVFGPEPNVKELMKIGKKFPQLILLAGILEGKFVSRNELEVYRMIPNLQTARCELLQTLNNVGGQAVSHLNTRQNILVSQLQERVKQLE